MLAETQVFFFLAEDDDEDDDVFFVLVNTLSWSFIIALCMNCPDVDMVLNSDIL